MDPIFIEAVHIRRLFGRYDYDLMQSSMPGIPKSLLLFYGDNGSGKTTILRTVYHLLSSGPTRGHRTAISRTPFKEFVVVLSDGRQVRVEREVDDLLGGYTLEIWQGEEVEFSTKVEAEDDLSVKDRNTDLREYERALREMHMDLFYLSDNRSAHSDRFEREDLMRQTEMAYFERGRHPARRSEFDLEALELERAMRRASQWIATQMMRSSNSAQQSSHAIYADVLARLLQPPPIVESGESGREVASAVELSEALAHLERRSGEFSRYGLTRPIEAASMIEVLDTASPEQTPLVVNVLTPYVDGLVARLEALHATYELVAPFIDAVNEFFWDKRIEYHPDRGLQVVSEGNQLILPTQLSSGERQLLLLLCSVLYMRDQTTLFIVDEPELSLNIKWQRRLIDALLTLTASSPSQFLLATHSMELLSSHSESVIRLEPVNSTEV